MSQGIENFIKKLRDETELSQEKLAAECGWYGKTRLSKMENGEQVPDAIDLDTLSKTFTRLLKRTIFAQDIVKFALSSTARMDVKSIPIIAPVQAGFWRESFEYSEDLRDMIPVPAHLESAPYFAVRLVGDSMNLEFQDGTILLCVSPYDLKTGIKDGDFIIVQRVRDGEYESTVKMLKIDEQSGRAHLMPRSNNPAHQLPIIIPWPFFGGRDPSSKTEKVEIIGVVIDSVTFKKTRSL